MGVFCFQGRRRRGPGGNRERNSRSAGAVDRLSRYAGISTHPSSHSVSMPSAVIVTLRSRAAARAQSVVSVGFGRLPASIRLRAAAQRKGRARRATPAEKALRPAGPRECDHRSRALRGPPWAGRATSSARRQAGPSSLELVRRPGRLTRRRVSASKAAILVICRDDALSGDRAGVARLVAISDNGLQRRAKSAVRRAPSTRPPSSIRTTPSALPSTTTTRASRVRPGGLSSLRSAP
jgi:hypothetical protein